MEEQLKEAQEEREAVQTEFVALKHNYLNAMADMQAEKTKNDEVCVCLPFREELSYISWPCSFRSKLSIL